MPELVRVDEAESGLLAAAAEKLGDTGVAEAALLAEPQPRQRGVEVPAASRT